MSSKWIPMIWKNKDRVFVSKTSWDSQSKRVKYKYDTDSSSKVYQGHRSNISASKSSQMTSTSKPDQSSSENDDHQKIKDFQMIATQCNDEIAANLLRNSKWDVQDALEFYFKNQSHINSSLEPNSNHNKPNTKPKKQSKSKPIKYGKAGTRTDQQKKLVKEIFNELYASFTDHEIICFTDGACRGNPGPAGSGCVVLYGKKQTNSFIQKSLALGRHTNNIGELYAIGLALHIIKHHPSSDGWIQSLFGNNNKRVIRILSDSQYSIGVLSKGWKAKKNVELIKWIKHDLDMISRDRFIVTFHWVGGHSGIQYNEMADSLANEGVIGSLNGKMMDVTKPPKLFESAYNDNVLKRGKKRKYEECGEDIECNERDRSKRRRLNVQRNGDGAEISTSSTPPQSPTIL